MNHELRIGLDPSNFHYRISDRIGEIGNSVYYHKIKEQPGIILFSISYSGKNAERSISGMIEEAASGISYFPFLINGFVKRTPDKNHGLSLRIETSPEIIRFHNRLKELSAAEGLIFQSCMTDEAELHIPLMNYPGFLDAEIIWRHATRKNRSFITGLLSLAGNSPRYKIRNFILPAESFRIELRNEKNPVKTYDLVLKRWFNKKNIQRCREGFEKFRILRGYESLKNNHTGNKEIFLSSDLHLGHTAIIEGAARPFLPGNPEKMDDVLIGNWNNTVKSSDKVYYLGDLTYNQGPDVCNTYLSKLNGDLVFIRGNHDICMDNSPENHLLKYSGREYYLVHDPKNRPDGYSGWMIHGHVHNSRISDYPFMDFKNKTINVCCELTGYHPVNLRDIDRVLEISEKEKFITEKFLLYEDILNLKENNREA